MSDTTIDQVTATTDVTRSSNVVRRLYRGETQFDFVGKRKIWFTISAIIIIAGIVAIGVRGLNLGIDFKG
jgi:preprotein translocase subunit SecF